MIQKYIKRIVLTCLFACVLLAVLGACSSDTTSTNNKGSSETGQVPEQGHGTPVVQGTTIVGTVTSGSTTGTGPTILVSPTPIPGAGPKSEQMVFKDRTLQILDVNKQKGSDANSVSVVLNVNIKNTSGQTIQNQADFFVLVGAEGDTFGKQTNSSDTFYGTIDAQSDRNGTIVFSVPSAAVKGLRLMYRSEVAGETVFMPLNLG